MRESAVLSSRSAFVNVGKSRTYRGGVRVGYPITKVDNESIVDALIIAVGRSLRAMVRRIRGAVPDEGLIDAALIQAEADSAIASFADDLEGHTITAGQRSAVGITREFAPDQPGIRLTFQPSHQTVISAFQTNRARITTTLMGQIREALGDLRVDIAGVNAPEAVSTTPAARPTRSRMEIRRDLVLNNFERSVVLNYRDALERGSLDALNRELRDRRFDARIRAAAAGDRLLTATQIDTMVGRYSTNLLNFRAESIQITEGVRIANEADELFVRQAFERGDLDPDKTKREWVTQADERVRGSHSAMHGQVRNLDDPFISGNGNSLRFPGDPNAPRSETIRCRCFIRTTVAGGRTN